MHVTPCSVSCRRYEQVNQQEGHQPTSRRQREAALLLAVSRKRSEPHQNGSKSPPRTYVRIVACYRPEMVGRQGNKKPKKAKAEATDQVFSPPGYIHHNRRRGARAQPAWRPSFLPAAAWDCNAAAVPGRGITSPTAGGEMPPSSRRQRLVEGSTVGGMNNSARCPFRRRELQPPKPPQVTASAQAWCAAASSARRRAYARRTEGPTNTNQPTRRWAPPRSRLSVRSTYAQRLHQPDERKETHQALKIKRELRGRCR